ncbi:MAG: hypothetical protein QOD99_1398 [Chthoniobacter sp.]|jgi:hypothetical protein|nr:hypothetical protein [Chthoniobacter sp.]
MIDAKLVWFSILSLAVAGLTACASDLALIWDGGAQFCFTLYHGEPYSYAARFFTLILWKPVIWAAHWTRNLATLRFLYGLPLCLAPAVSATLAWWMVKRTRPDLFPWALLGISAASIPVQCFVINESIFQLNMFWPVFLGMLVPLDRARALVIACLLVFQFSHPQGLLLLSAVAAGLALLGNRRRNDDWSVFRKRALWMAATALVCLLKIVVFPDPEAAHQANPLEVLILFWQGLAGWPLAGWLFLVAAVWCSRELERKWLASVLLVAAACACWWWAADPVCWAKALDARRFVPFLAAPFFFGAWFAVKRESRWRIPAGPLWRCATAAAVIFSATLGLQAFGWHRLRARLLTQLEADPRVAIPVEDFSWMRGGPGDHWGLGAQVIASLGGRKLVLDQAGRAAIGREPPLVALGYDAWIAETPGVLGWFDFRETIRKARLEAHP